MHSSSRRSSTQPDITDQIAREGRKSVLQPFSSNRFLRSSAWQDELTINKLRFHELGLYGREEQMAQLLQCLEKAAAPDQQRQVVMIEGSSGAGKSRLAKILRNPVLKRQRTKDGRTGLFLSGKFDWNRHDEPYVGIAQACGDLCGQMLRRNNDPDHSTNGHPVPCQQLCQALVEELEFEVNVLLRFVPILEEILLPFVTTQHWNAGSSSQPHNMENREDSLHVSAETNKNRFNYAFRRLMRVIGRHHSVVVVVLDDLQWADHESLQLLQVLSRDRENSNLLLLGCYRSNEIDELHPFPKVLDELKHQSTAYDSGWTEISVENLTLEQVNHMLMDLLSKSNEHETLGLAHICHKKTLGNPFFLQSFLELLHKNHLLEFNLGRTEWVWNDEEIENQTRATINVVDVLALRMKEECKMTSDLAKFLQVAACLGSTFSKIALLCVWKKFQETHGEEKVQTGKEILRVAVETGYLEEAREGECRWVHDKILESAFSLSPPDELKVLQAKIGKLLVSEFRHDELMASTIFIAANLLNGGPAPADREESIQRAELNLDAVEKAMMLSAMESATKYGSTGIQYLPKECWTSHTELTLDLYSAVGEAEGYLGNVESMEFYCNAIIERNEVTLLDKARAYNVVIDSVANRNKVVKAKNLCMDVLAKLDCTFPKNPIVRRFQIKSGLKDLQQKGTCRTLTELSKATLMEDPLKLEAMKLLEKLATYCFITNDWDLYHLVVLREVRWTDCYGLNENSPHGYSCAGLILTSMVGDFRKGSVYGEYALLVMDRLQIKRLVAATKFVVYSFVLHWTKPSQLTVRPLLESYESGMQAGNVEYAMYGAHGYLLTLFAVGRPLETLERDCMEYTQQMAEFNRDFVRTEICCIWQTVRNLMIPSEDPCGMTGGVIADEHFLPTASPFLAEFIKFYQRYLCSLFGRHQQVAELATGNEGLLPMLHAVPGSIQLLLEALGTGVSLFAAARQTKNSRYKKAGMRVLTTVKRWVEKGNPNARHIEALLEAEKLAAWNGSVHVAKKNFEVAIALASRGGFIQDAAFAYERYGDFLMEHSEEDAAFHIGEAIRLYREWGAGAKVAYLEAKYTTMVFKSPAEIAFINRSESNS